MLSVEQLRRIAQFIGTKGYASATREQLIEMILEHQDQRSPIIYKRGDGLIDVSEKVNMYKYIKVDVMKRFEYLRDYFN